MNRRRAFTMLELVLTTLLLGVMFGVVFALFNMATGAFNYSVTRQDLQSEGRRIMNSLDSDLRQTDVHSVAVVNDATRLSQPGSLPRHGLSFAGVHDWSKAGALDSVSMQPAWDHYVVYYATLTQPFGSLIHAILEPPAGEISGLPLDRIVNNPSLFLNDPPTSNPPLQTKYELLSRNVESFQVQSSTVVAGINFRVVLKDTARRSEPARNSKLSFDIHFDIIPENTKPRR